VSAAQPDAGRPGGPGRPLDPSESPVQAFAWALVELRTAHGISVRKLAKAISYDPSTVSRVAKGDALPQRQLLRAYAEGCGGDGDAWTDLLALAEAAAAPAADDEDRLEFAEALVALCTAALPGYAGGLGGPRELAAAWSGTGPAVPPGPAAASGTAAGAAVAGSPDTAPRWARPGAGRTRRAVVAAVTAVALIASGALLNELFGGGGNDDDGKKPPGDGKVSTAPPLAACNRPGPELTFVSSTEKAAALKDLAESFGPRQSGSECVRVTVRGIDSGTAMQALADGWNSKLHGARPDVWSPASKAWLGIARHRAAGKPSLDRLPGSAGSSIVTSPLTVAMPKPDAEGLGWPEKKLSWKDLADLARKPGFKLGKTSPEHSTSGLNATIAAFYAQAGATRALSSDDLADKDNRATVSAIERAAVHYGDTTLTFLENLRRYDKEGRAADYIQAVAIEESSVIAYNMGYPCGTRSDEPKCRRTKEKPTTGLVAFYPTNGSGAGTMDSDHPYITLNGLSAAKKAVAEDFRRYLRTTETARERFADLGFRTADGRPTTHVAIANGVLPDGLPEPLPTPSAEVLDGLLTAWRDLRKPANVLVVIDTSGSMDENPDGGKRVTGGVSKLDLVKGARGSLLAGFTDRDRVGLWSFSHRHTAEAEIAPLGTKDSGGTTHRARIDGKIDGLKDLGSTALYTTVRKAVETLRGNYDTSAINAVVVLSDGRNEVEGGIGLEELVAEIGDPDKDPVRVFTIAYGAKADTGSLKRIAEGTAAHAYEAADPRTISKVLTNVTSNF
jgi:Ca-activated chloride channel homolog